MATQGYVVAWVVLGFIFLITVIVWLATSPGSKSGSGGSPTGAGAPGSAGNWTAAQVAEQATVRRGLMGEFGLEQAFIDTYSDCFTRAMSTLQTYDYAKACNTKGSACDPTDAEMRAVSTCCGGATKGKWPIELKRLLAASAPANSEPAMLKAWPCIIAYLAETYDYSDAMAAMKNAKAGDDLTRAIMACMGT